MSNGLLDTVSKMLQSYGGNPNTPSPDKNALVAACERCDAELVDVLLKNGADLNPASASRHPYSNCKLPLCAAVAQSTSVDIIKLLIKAGADVNAVDSEGRTALCIASKIMTIDRYRYYLSTKAMRNIWLTIRLLLEHGADVKELMPDSRSLLHLVVSAIARNLSRTHLIELLLVVNHGAVISDFFDNTGQDSCRRSRGILKDLATFDGKHEFIVELFQAGAEFQLIALCCNAVQPQSVLPAIDSGKARSIHLCRAAVLAGYTPSAAELQDFQLAAASEDANSGSMKQLVNWLNEDRQRVPSLLRKCRVAIRRRLSAAVQHRSILPAIDQLPLPNTMKMYLQFTGKLTEVDAGDECSAEMIRELMSPPDDDFITISDVEDDTADFFEYEDEYEYEYKYEYEYEYEYKYEYKYEYEYEYKYEYEYSLNMNSNDHDSSDSDY